MALGLKLAAWGLKLVARSLILWENHNPGSSRSHRPLDIFTMQLPPGSRRAHVELIPMGPLPFPITAGSLAAVLPVLYPGLSFMSMIIFAWSLQLQAELEAWCLKPVACGPDQGARYLQCRLF